MKIVVLDGEGVSRGDVSWGPLEGLGELTVYADTPPELVVRRAEGAFALIINRIKMTKEVFAALPELKFVGMLATGYNAVDVEFAKERGVTVCNVPDYCKDAVAQHAMALLLSLCSNAEKYSALVKAGEWKNAESLNFGAYPIIELSGKTLGIIGFGGIGQAVAKIALAFNMNVLVFSGTKRKLPAGCRWAEPDEIFAASDAVTLHCPLTDETRHLVNEKRLSLMKKTAFLINTSRGGVADSTALAAALNEGRLAGAGIDVMESEPPKENDPLLTAKNCIITPHIAWAPKEARERLVSAVAENLSAYLSGRAINVVNP